jgi:putative membrane protein
MSDQSEKGVAKEDANLKLAADRTRLAYERTMMAWIRTAISLITFGFAIYKFFQFMVVAGGETPKHILSPREFGLIMISIGLLGLLLATWQQRRDLKALKMQYPHLSIYSPARMLAALVAILGLLALLAVFFRR